MSSKLDIKKFKGNMSFSLRKNNVKTILTHQGLYKALLEIKNMRKTLSLEEKHEQD